MKCTQIVGPAQCAHVHGMHASHQQVELQANTFILGKIRMLFKRFLMVKNDCVETDYYKMGIEREHTLGMNLMLHFA